MAQLKSMLSACAAADTAAAAAAAAAGGGVAGGGSSGVGPGAAAGTTTAAAARDADSGGAGVGVAGSAPSLEAWSDNLPLASQVGAFEDELRAIAPQEAAAAAAAAAAGFGVAAVGTGGGHGGDEDEVAGILDWMAAHDEGPPPADSAAAAAVSRVHAAAGRFEDDDLLPNANEVDGFLQELSAPLDSDDEGEGAGRAVASAAAVAAGGGRAAGGAGASTAALEAALAEWDDIVNASQQAFDDAAESGDEPSARDAPRAGRGGVARARGGMRGYDGNGSSSSSSDGAPARRRRATGSAARGRAAAAGGTSAAAGAGGGAGWGVVPTRPHAARSSAPRAGVGGAAGDEFGFDARNPTGRAEPAPLAPTAAAGVASIVVAAAVRGRRGASVPQLSLVAVDAGSSSQRAAATKRRLAGAPEPPRAALRPSGVPAARALPAAPHSAPKRTRREGGLSNAVDGSSAAGSAPASVVGAGSAADVSMMAPPVGEVAVDLAGSLATPRCDSDESDLPPLPKPRSRGSARAAAAAAAPAVAPSAPGLGPREHTPSTMTPAGARAEAGASLGAPIAVHLMRAFDAVGGSADTAADASGALQKDSACAVGGAHGALEQRCDSGAPPAAAPAAAPLLVAGGCGGSLHAAPGDGAAPSARGGGETGGDVVADAAGAGSPVWARQPRSLSSPRASDNASDFCDVLSPVLLEAGGAREAGAGGGGAEASALHQSGSGRKPPTLMTPVADSAVINVLSPSPAVHGPSVPVALVKAAVVAPPLRRAARRGKAAPSVSGAGGSSSAGGGAAAAAVPPRLAVQVASGGGDRARAHGAGAAPFVSGTGATAARDASVCIDLTTSQVEPVWADTNSPPLQQAAAAAGSDAAVGETVTWRSTRAPTCEHLRARMRTFGLLDTVVRSSMRGVDAWAEPCALHSTRSRFFRWRRTCTRRRARLVASPSRSLDLRCDLCPSSTARPHAWMRRARTPAVEPLLLLLVAVAVVPPPAAVSAAARPASMLRAFRLSRMTRPIGCLRWRRGALAARQASLARRQRPACVTARCSAHAQSCSRRGGRLAIARRSDGCAAWRRGSWSGPRTPLVAAAALQYLARRALMRTPAALCPVPPWPRSMHARRLRGWLRPMARLAARDRGRRWQPPRRRM